MNYEVISQNLDFIEPHQAIIKEADEVLDQYLMSLLKSVNIEITPTKLEDIKKRYGHSAQAVASILYKTLYYADDIQRKAVTIPEEFGHFFTVLAGPKTPMIKELLTNIERWQGYDKVYQEYKNVYVLKDGEDMGRPDEVMIRFEAVGKLIGEALVYRNEELKSENKNYFIQKALEFVEFIMEKMRSLLNKLKPNKGLNSDLLEISAMRIADGILTKDKFSDYLNIYDKPNEAEYKLTTYESTLEKHPDAATLINIMSDLGASLTGSLVLRKQGLLKRSDNESLHDFDWNIPYEVWSKDGWENYIEKIQEKIPNMKFMWAWDPNPTYKTAHLAISDVPGLPDKFKTMKGTFNDRMDALTDFERDNFILVDLFFQQSPVETIDFNNFNIWTNIISWKVSMARAKDIYDYQVWKPYPEYEKMQTEKEARFTYYSLPTKAEVREQALDLLAQYSSKKEGKIFRKYKGTYYARKHAYAESSNKIGQLNREVFGGAKVFKLKNRQFENSVQAVIEIDPTPYLQLEKANAYYKTGIQTNMFYEKEQTPFNPVVDTINNIEVPFGIEAPAKITRNIDRFRKDMSVFYNTIKGIQQGLFADQNIQSVTNAAFNMIDNAYKQVEEGTSTALSEMEADIDKVFNMLPSKDLESFYNMWSSNNENKVNFSTFVNSFYGFRRGYVRRTHDVPLMRPFKSC